MSKRWLYPVGGLLAVIGLCSGCLWSIQPRPRFSQEFDIGGGRILRVWSIADSEWFEPNPLMVYYRVDLRGKELVHRTFLEHDDGGEYQFKVAFADGGRLACVYEINRGKDCGYYLLMFDASTGESWPRLREDEADWMPEVMEKWGKRYRRLKAENPELPTPPRFNNDYDNPATPGDRLRD
jgi:hypothetical protein